MPKCANDVTGAQVKRKERFPSPGFQLLTAQPVSPCGGNPVTPLIQQTFIHQPLLEYHLFQFRPRQRCRDIEIEEIGVKLMRELEVLLKVLRTLPGETEHHEGVGPDT